MLLFACTDTGDRGDVHPDSVDPESDSADAHSGNADIGPAEPLTLQSAIEGSLPYLESKGVAWMDGTAQVQNDNAEGCVSCHQVPFGLWGLEEARRAGVDHGWDGLEDLTERAWTFETPAGAKALFGALLLLGRDLTDSAAAADTVALVERIIDDQITGGHWDPEGQFNQQRRASIAEMYAVATQWVLLAMASVGTEIDGAASATEQGLAWLDSALPGESTEWLVTTMLVQTELGNPQAGQEHKDSLLSQQNDDGGWSWFPEEPSNAFSTGLTLYALRRAGLAPDHESISGAVAYLLERQQENGSWAVASELTSKQPGPTMDYVYGYWGTAWATIGLSRVLQGLSSTELE